MSHSQVFCAAREARDTTSDQPNQPNQPNQPTCQVASAAAMSHGQAACAAGVAAAEAMEDAVNDAGDVQPFAAVSTHRMLREVALALERLHFSQVSNGTVLQLKPLHLP